MEGDEASFYQAARRLARRTGRQAAGISALFDDGRGQAEVHVLAWRLGALKAPDLGCERAGRYPRRRRRPEVLGRCAVGTAL